MKYLYCLLCFLCCSLAAFSQNEMPSDGTFVAPPALSDTQKVHATSDFSPEKLPSQPPAQTSSAQPCNAPTIVQCNTRYRSQTNIGFSNNFNSTQYNCDNGNIGWNANDRVYQITLTEKSDLYIRIDSFASANSDPLDLDLFLLSSCQPANCIASSLDDNPGTNIFMESIWRNDLDAGIYYIIVDGYLGDPANGDYGNFNLEIQCNCTCTEVNNDVRGDLLLTEQFEVYGAGNINPQSNRWNVWPTNNSADAPVVNQGGTKFLQLTENPASTTDPDVWYSFTQRTSGRYRVTFNMMMEPGKGGNFYGLHVAPTSGNTSGNVGYRVAFNANGTGAVSTGNNLNGILANFQYPNGQWIRVMQILDIDQNEAELWINGNFVAQWPFNLGSGGNSSELRGLDFDARNTGYSYRVDNICVWRTVSPCICTTQFDPVCIENGSSESNICFAQCLLYTTDEITPCLDLDVCDYGGTYLYRGENVGGTLDASDLAAPLIRADPCVAAAYGGAANIPNPFYADVYVFYDEDGQGVIPSVTLNDPSQHYFVMSCNWEGVNFDQPTFLVSNGSLACNRSMTVLESDAGSCFNGHFSCDNFYYIVVTGAANTTYGVAVFPNGPCDPNPTILQCGTPVNGQTDDFSNFPDPDNDPDGGYYNDCYNGSRVYNGGEKLYKFTLDQASTVKISMNAPGNLGFFLFSYLCGRECIGYAENTPFNPNAIFATPLNAGSYYIVVDANTLGTNPNFSLQVDCTPQGIFPDIDIFTVYDITSVDCPTDLAAAHSVGIRSTAYNFSPDDQIAFAYFDNAGEPHSPDEMRQYWHNSNQPMYMDLPADIPNDGLKCSYETGDALLMYVVENINGSNRYTPVELKFGPLNPPGVTAAGQFAPEATSDVVEAIPQDVATFSAQPPAINALPNRDTAFLQFISSKPWEVTYSSPAPWLTMNLYASDGQENLRLYFEPQPANAVQPRTTVLRFKEVTSAPNPYQAFVRVTQQGRCLPPNFNIVASTTQVCTGQPVNLSVDPLGNGNIFTYLWSTGDTSRVLPTKFPTGPTTYSVTVTNRFCFSYFTKSVSITVTQPPNPPSNPANQQICAGAGALPQPLAVTAPTGATINWYNQANGGTLLRQNSPTFTPNPLPTSTTTYYAESSAGAGCVNQNRTAVTLTVNQPPTVALQDTICQSNLQFYNAVVTTSIGSSCTATQGTVTGGPNVFTIENVPKSASSILVTATSTAGCQSTFTIVSPKCNCAPLAAPLPANGGNQMYCAGQTKPSLRVEVGPSETADWFDSPTGQNMVANGVTEFLPPGNSGTFWVRRRNLTNNCTSGQFLQISLSENPKPTLSQANQPECSPDRTTYSVILAASAGSTVLVPAPATATLQGGNWLVSGVPAGQDLTATAIFQNTNCQSPALVVPHPVCQCPDVPAPVSQGDKSYCANEPIPSISVSVNAGEAVEWFNAALGGQSFGTQNPWTPSAPGDYFAERRIVASACTSAVRTRVRVTVKPLPSLAVDSVFCENGFQQYSILFSSSTTNFSISGSYAFVPTGGNTYVVVDIPLGETVNITANLSGCLAVQSVLFSEDDCQCPAIAPPSSCGDMEMCANGNVPTLCVAPGNGQVMSWFPAQTGGLPYNNGINTDNFTPPGPGTYWVQAQLLNTVCVSATRTPVTLSVVQAPQVMVGQDRIICSDEKVPLSGFVSGPGVTNAFWTASEPGGIFQPNNGISATNYTPPTGATSVLLTLTTNDPIGPCAAVSDQLNVTVNPVPTYTIDSVKCSPNLDTYNVWFTTNAPDINPSAGNLQDLGNNHYQLGGLQPNSSAEISLLFGQTGCDSKFTITSPPGACACPPINPPTSLGNVTVCQGATTGNSLSVSVPTGLQVRWYDAAGNLVWAGPSYTPPGQGSFFAETFDPQNGCSSLQKTEVKLTILPAPLANAGADQQVCPGETSTLSALNGPGYQFLWSNGQSGPSITVPAQNFMYILTVSLGSCVKVDTVLVSLAPAASAEIMQTTDIQCFGDATGGLMAVVTGGTAPTWVWSNGSTGQSITGLLAGTYRLYAVNAESCRDTAVFTLQQPPPLDLGTVIIDNTSGLQVSDGGITVQAEGGVPPYHYQWYTGAGIIMSNDTFPQISDRLPGLYRVWVTDANGCLFLSDLIEIQATIAAGEPDWGGQVRLFPNPSTGQVWLQCEFPTTLNVQTTLYDLPGRELKSEDHGRFRAATLPLDLSDLPPGTYWLQIRAGSFSVAKRVVLSE